MLETIRVVELGAWVAGPAAAGLLAEWGAEVIKVEAPQGDPMRRFFRLSAGSRVDRNPPFELDNRGKKSVVLDLHDAAAREAFERLLASADVFVTNLRPGALARLDLDPGAVRGRHPRLVYASITGYGLRGPDRDRPGYDVGAFWSRPGLATTFVPGESPPLPLRGGFGDHVTALAATAGILAALFERERTGSGKLVETSLMRTGMYCLGWDLGIQLAFGKVKPTVAREENETPLVNCYRAGDGRWFWLLGLEADRHFPALARALERDDLLRDPRFADARLRRHNRRELIAALDAAFREQPLHVWAKRFDAAGVWWAPAQRLDEVVDDPQADAAGAFVELYDRGTGNSLRRAVASPVSFDQNEVRRRPAPPRAGEDTRTVLAELGLPPKTVERLAVHSSKQSDLHPPDDDEGPG